MKKLLLFALAILFAGSAWAQTTFTSVNAGKTIYYKTISATEVEVTNDGSEGTYVGVVHIPATVNHTVGDVTTTYTVTRIAANAFRGYNGSTAGADEPTNRFLRAYIPCTVTEIGDRAFYNVRTVTSVFNAPVHIHALGNTAATLGTKVFYESEGLDGFGSKLEHLYYPTEANYNSWADDFEDKHATATYTLSLDVNGGSVTTPIVFNVFNGYFVQANNLPIPTREGFDFNGWLMNGVAFPNAKADWNANVVLTASWSPKTYHLTYNAMCVGVTPEGPAGLPVCTAPEGQTFTANDAVTLDVTMTRGGYTFAGWYTNEDLTEGPITSIPVGTVNNVTVYAKWEAKTFAVIYIDPLGNFIDNEFVPTEMVGLTPTEFTFGEETAPALPETADKMGYTLNGWNPEAINTLYADDQKFTANWTPNTYDVVYDANGGAGTHTQEITYDAWRSELGVAIYGGAGYTKVGYTIKGWNTVADGTGTYYAINQVLDHDLAGEGEVTLYAVWEANTYALRFNEAGGTLAESMEPTYGEAIGTLPVSTQTGLAFIGWYIDGVKISAETVWNHDGRKVAYAVWYKAIELKADCEETESGKIKVRFKTNYETPITFNVSIDGDATEFATGGEVMNFTFQDLAAGDYTVVVEGADNTFETVNVHDFNFTFTSTPDLTLPVQGGEAVVFTAIGNGNYTWDYTPALNVVDNNERLDLMGTFTEATTVSVTGTYEAIGGGICEKTMTLDVDVQVCPEPIVADVDGNEYNVFDFDGKCWFRGNLRAENYAPVAGAEAVEIPFARVYEHPEVADIPESYGKLYNWSSAANGTLVSPLIAGRQGACPEGWRLPTAGDLNAMTQYTSTQLRTDEAGWINGVGTNETGFTAEPAGVYNPGSQNFEKIYSRTGFWSSTINANGEATYGQICYTCDQFTMEQTANQIGLSVRCIQVIEPMVYVIDATTAGVKGFFARGDFDLSGIEFRAEGATEWTVIGVETFGAFDFEFAAELTAGTYEYRAVVKNGEETLYAGETQTFVVE